VPAGAGAGATGGGREGDGRDDADRHRLRPVRRRAAEGFGSDAADKPGGRHPGDGNDLPPTGEGRKARRERPGRPEGPTGDRRTVGGERNPSRPLRPPSEGKGRKNNIIFSPFSWWGG